VRISSELTTKLSAVGGGLGDGWEEAPIFDPVPNVVRSAVHSQERAGDCLILCYVPFPTLSPDLTVLNTRLSSDLIVIYLSKSMLLVCSCGAARNIICVTPLMTAAAGHTKREGERVRPRCSIRLLLNSIGREQKLSLSIRMVQDQGESKPRVILRLIHHSSSTPRPLPRCCGFSLHCIAPTDV